MIAEDVLAQLDAGKYLANHMSYVRSRTDERCAVCAVGSAFISSMMLSGTRDFNASVEAFEIDRGLDIFGETSDTGAFNVRELKNMERAFEGGDIADGAGVSQGDWLGRMSLCAEDRLRKIMETIMLNCGEVDLTSLMFDRTGPIGTKAVYERLAQKKVCA